MPKGTKVSATLKEAAKTQKSISIEQPMKNHVCLEIEGTAPLIQNAFPQKAIEQMLRKHMGLTVTREKKKPREVLEAATIKNLDDRVCVPPAGVKKAMLTASGTVKIMPATKLRVMLFVVGKSVPITFEKMVPRMDMCRTSGMTRAPDVRFRPSFFGWKARVLLEYAEQLDVQTVVDLLNRAGTVGVGEWRPEKSGTFGTFKISRHITDRKEIAEVEAQCATPIKGLEIPDWAMDAEIDPELLKRIAGGEEEETDTEGTDEERAEDAIERASGGRRGKRA